MRSVVITAFCIVALAVGAVAYADTNPQATQARREELARVQEMLADPDPLMRLANMESIVNSRDPVRIMLALRTAFASDDADLRSLALRAYLTTHTTIIFEVALPPAIEKQYDAAGGTEDRDLNARYPFVSTLIRVAFRFSLTISDYGLGQEKGMVWGGQGGVGAGVFTLTGSRFSTFTTLRDIGSCYVDFSPSRKQTLEGNLACGGWPKLPISAPAS